jgi:C4-dicarboxylate-specific signal transduction histidine kinase
MLKFSGPSRPRSSAVSINRVIEDSLRLIGKQAADKMASVQTRFDSPSDLVVGDANQLEQVFLNLLLNAFEAVPQGGGVVITTRALPDKNQIETVIIDNGPGLPEEALGHLFQPFFTTKEGGTGLGLCITKAIVDAHGGSITARNLPDAGASFSVLLPAHVPGERE